MCLGLLSLAVSSYCCCSSLCLVSMFSVPSGCAGRQGRLCRTGVQPYKYRALSLSYTCRKSRVSSVVKCIWLRWLSFPFSLISPHNLACLFWGKQKEFCCCWMLAQVVILSHLISMSLVVRSGLWLYGCQDRQFSKFHVLNLKIFNSCWFSEVVIPSV